MSKWAMDDHIFSEIDEQISNKDGRWAAINTAMADMFMNGKYTCPMDIGGMSAPKPKWALYCFH